MKGIKVIDVGTNPNLLKFGEVGYFPEQFIVDFDLQGKTASEIAIFFYINRYGYRWRCYLS